MKFQLVLAAMAAVAGTLVAATPQPHPPVLEVRDLGDEGVLTVYARDETSGLTARDELQRRCGSNHVTCSNENQAPKGVCQDLINQVCGDDRNKPIKGTSICLQRGETCCITWTGTDGPFPRGNVCDAARKTLEQCGGDGKVSGFAVDVNLSNACVHQCMSNRVNGC